MTEMQKNFEELEKLTKRKNKLDQLDVHYMRLFTDSVVAITANGYTHTLSEATTSHIKQLLVTNLTKERIDINNEISKYTITKG